MNYKKILIAVDGSSIAIKAAEEGITLARKLEAEIGLIYVVDTNMVIGTSETNISPQTILQQFKEEGSEILKKIEAKTGISLFKFEPEGKPVEEIINAAQNWSADIIVIGTHGRTGLKHLLMGSVSENVIRHSRIPVLVVTA